MEDRERELTLERDFLLRVLELGHHDDVAALVSEALDVIVDLSGARHGYIELTPGVGGGSESGFFALHGGLEREAVRELLSSTIMEASRREGVIVTQIAHADPRFEEARSVRRHQIDAVICAPIGEPPLGVVYLQGAPNRGGQGFAPHVARLVALFARHLAPVAQRLMRRPSGDPTGPWRDRL
ncbi:MAG TPA: GAF domain-containing protein, partial [Myxococcota bacterium]|nr:GAF domain-containing protein [Myxococcota bacterium]